jgi:hypothetical protein
VGNLIQRNRGKRGAPDVTRNLSTGKVTTTYRDPRKKGSLGLRVTKSHDNKGNVHVTESFNYGGGVTKKSRTKQNKSFSFGSRTTSGRTRKSGGSSVQLPADAQAALILLGGGLVLIGWAIYFAITYWYISIPATVAIWYYFFYESDEDRIAREAAELEELRQVEIARKAKEDELNESLKGLGMRVEVNSDGTWKVK